MAPFLPFGGFMNFKGIIAATIMCFSISAFGAEKLIELTQYPGYAPPQFQNVIKISIFDDGRVEKSVRSLRDTETSSSIIAQLDDIVVSGLLKNTERIESQELKDVDSGRPRCADAPSTEVKLGNDVNGFVVYKKAFCHHWKLTNNSDAYLVENVTEFLNLMLKVTWNQ